MRAGASAGADAGRARHVCLASLLRSFFIIIYRLSVNVYIFIYVYVYINIERIKGFFFCLFFEQLGLCPPWSWCPMQTAYSAYRERRYWSEAQWRFMSAHCPQGYLFKDLFLVFYAFISKRTVRGWGRDRETLFKNPTFPICLCLRSYACVECVSGLERHLVFLTWSTLWIPAVGRQWSEYCLALFSGPTLAFGPE